jgi:hypothetical protein
MSERSKGSYLPPKPALPPPNCFTPEEEQEVRDIGAEVKAFVQGHPFEYHRRRLLNGLARLKVLRGHMNVDIFVDKELELASDALENLKAQIMRERKARREHASGNR